MKGRRQVTGYILQVDLYYSPYKDNTALQPHLLKLNILAKLTRLNRLF